MRILLTTDTVGGVWTFTQELTGQLLQRGHDVALVSFGREPTGHHVEWVSETARTYGEQFLFRASTAPLEWMDANERTWPEGEAALRAALREFDAHLVHSNQFCFGALDINLPVVVTAHSDVLSWAEACRPGGLAEGPWLTQYLDLVGEGLKHADALAAPTQWMAETLVRLYRPEQHVRVVPNGRSLPPFYPGTVRAFQAVAAGRLWDEAKGLRLLLAIDSALPLQIAGDLTLNNDAVGPPPLPAQTHLLGPLSQPALFELFRTSAVYLATSLYEPFGYAPLEAALCGCAIIARDLASFREVWGDGALYFQTHSDLERLLRELRDSEAAFLGARDRSIARARTYTAEKMADNYLALYTAVLDARQRQAPKETFAHVN